MEELLENPNLAFDILPRIFQCLANETLQSCQEVHKSMKMIVDNPRFWIKRMKKISVVTQSRSGQPDRDHCISIENLKKWMKLLVLAEKKNLVENFVKTILSCNWSDFLRLETPLHVASYIGDVSLVDLIHQELTDGEISLYELKSHPFALAAMMGHVGVVSLLLSKYDYSNIVRGCSLNAAAMFGRYDVVR